MATVIKTVNSSYIHRSVVNLDRHFLGASSKFYYSPELKTLTTNTFNSTRTTHQPDNWNWRDRIRKHLNATTYLVGTHSICEPASASFSATWRAWDGTAITDQYDKGSGEIPPVLALPTAPSSAVNAEAAYQAKMKLYKTLRDKRQAWEGMTFIGELGELLRMLRRPAGAFRDGLDDWISSVKKLNRRSSLSNLNRSIAGSYLEWVYGMAPTIGDLDNVTEAINRHLERYEELYQKFMVESDGFPTSSTNWVNVNYGFYPWTFHCRHRTLNSSKVVYRGQVFTAAAHAEGFTRQQLGFELRNFVPTVWELLPYSFVADYFSNIGELLEGMTTFTGDVAWIAETIINQSERQVYYYGYTLDSVINPSMTTVTNLRVNVSAPHPSRSIVRKVTRTAIGGVPVVNPFKDFRLKVPGVGSTKWINLTALFASSRSTENLFKFAARR